MFKLLDQLNIDNHSLVFNKSAISVLFTFPIEEIVKFKVLTLKLWEYNSEGMWCEYWAKIIITITSSDIGITINRNLAKRTAVLW